MPPLKNLKHELFARNLVKTKFNQTKAYDLTYPDSSYEAAQPNSSRISNDITTERALELLAQEEGMSLPTLIKSLHDDLNAKRPVVIKGKLQYTRDNNTIWDVKKTLLLKAYQIGEERRKRVEVGRINMIVNQLDSDKFTKSVEKLDKLHEKLELKATKVV